jgi:Repeat of unknown function (DUF5650)
MYRRHHKVRGTRSSRTEGSAMTASNILQRLVVACFALGLAPSSGAAPVDLAGPPGSQLFGHTVTVLPNGNFVVTDPLFGANEVGAVYLYSPGGTLISTLTGSSANDHVGERVTVLASGNYVVVSFVWDNGGAIDAGAVTWCNAATGINGVVSAANSLVGTTTGDHVGAGGVATLSNGHYVVVSPDWDNGTSPNEGAVTWGSGTIGVTGAVSGTNSLVGPPSLPSASDRIGSRGVIPLTNGNYVVASPDFDGGSGAVTWRSGNKKTGGAGAVVTTSNSLVGHFRSNDQVGALGAAALTNGNYVVSSPYWNNIGAVEAGAVTWGDGANGTTVGVVTPDNSLVGTTAYDHVGSVRRLNNGNYVVSSCDWDNAGAADAGAATWGDGVAGISGPVSAANSLLDACSAVPLANGNYVVATSSWNNGFTVSAGAVTWRNGSIRDTSPITPLNALVGTSAYDQVGFQVRQLTNGNYVVYSAYNLNGVALGAVTLGDGAIGTIGAVTINNSIVGTSYTSLIGSGGVYALNNGNFVFASPVWDDGPVADAGAVSWASGTSATTGVVSAANSLIGSTDGDSVGNPFNVSGIHAAVLPLRNGNYVLLGGLWDNGNLTDAGAVTWGNGATGTHGPVTPANSLVGGLADDRLGDGGSAGAFSDGSYAFTSIYWSDAGFHNGGAVTLAWGGGPSSGGLTPANSVFGTVPDQAESMVFDYDPTHKQLVVGRPASNIVSLLKLDVIFKNHFESN